MSELCRYFIVITTSSYIKPGGTGHVKGGKITLFKIFERLPLVFMLLVLCSRPVTASLIGDIASQMQPGEWRAVPTIGFNDDLLFSPRDTTHHALGWTEDMVWDPVTQQILYIGGGHEADTMFLVYSAASNTWRRITPLAPGWVRTGPGGLTDHAYDHNAIAPSVRRFYHRQFFSSYIDIYNIDTGAWSRSQEMPNYAQCCGALEYFPEMGGLVYLDGSGALYLMDVNTGSWRTLAGSFRIGPYHNFAEYSPVAKVLLFGGGHDEVVFSRDLYRMDASGTITRMNDAPIPLGVNLSVVTVDPNSGRFLIFGNDGSFYEYDALSDTWRQQTVSPPFMADGGVYNKGIYGAMVAPVPNYNVIAVAKYNEKKSKLYLYKHSPGSGKAVPIKTISNRKKKAKRGD